MKDLMIVFATMSSLTAFASSNSCPQLSGEYIGCSTGSERVDDELEVPESYKVSQGVNNGQDFYQFAGDKNAVDIIKVGGKNEMSYSVDEELTLELDRSAKCINNDLQLTYKITNTVFHNPESSSEERIAISEMMEEIVAQMKMSFKLVGDSLIIDDGDYPITCTKVK